MTGRLMYICVFFILAIWLGHNLSNAQMLIPIRVFQLQPEGEAELEKCPVEECMKFCEETYSPHTYEKTDDHLICKRGCRLYAMITHSTADDGSNTTLNQCSGACRESYSKEEEASVCLAGCKKQSALFAELKPQAEQQQEEGEAGNMMMLHQVPLAYDQVFRTMIDHMESMFNRMIQEDMEEAQGPVAIIRIRTFMRPGGPEMMNGQWFPTANGGAEMNQLQAMALDGAEDDQQTEASGGSYVSCLKMHLPRLLMLSLLMLSSIFLLWLACSTLETAPKQRLSISSDKVVEVNSEDCDLVSYDEAVKKSLKPSSIPEGHPLIVLPIEMFEAGPLPEKSRL